MLPITALLNLTDEPPVISTPAEHQRLQRIEFQIACRADISSTGADEEEECNKTGGQTREHIASVLNELYSYAGLSADSSLELLARQCLPNMV